jgi:hypothetical protein
MYNFPVTESNVFAGVKIVEIWLQIEMKFKYILFITHLGYFVCMNRVESELMMVVLEL